MFYTIVDNEIWAKRIAAQIPNIQVDNLTDFNYAKCFTLFIVPSVLPGIRLGTDKFKSYIKKNSDLTGLMVYISAVAPFAAIKYVMYQYMHGELVMQEQDERV
jgi:hypothetical protein